jgi:CheY-like chemotaxis protein/two-component sensor histidine kinase
VTVNSPQALRFALDSVQAAESDGDLAAALHEVSNALTVVLGWLEAASTEVDAASVREALEVARVHARLGHRIARRAIGAEVSGDETDRSAVTLVRQAILGVAQEAEKKGVQIRLDVSIDDNVLLCSGAEAQQILLNLLLNAVAFSPSHGVVTIRVDRSATHVVFEVMDQGPGIPADRADSLLSAPDSTRRGGAGIGLRYSNALARLHGGELRLARTGPGACFELGWPLSEARSGARSVPPRTRSLDGARVLVVEDDPAVRSLLELALEARGVQVLVAGGRSELERVMSRGAILDAALVDLSPIVDDPEHALATLRRGDAGLPVILISGAPDGIPGSLAHAFAAWVRKPFEMGEVIAALERVLRPG